MPRPLLFTVVLFSLALPALGQKQMDALARGYVETEKNAYLVLPKELIAAPSVQIISYSPNKRYLLASRIGVRVSEATLKGEPPKGDQSLILWDAKTRKAREIWKADLLSVNVEEIRWLAKSQTALIRISRTFFDPKAPKPMQVQRTPALLRFTPEMERPQEITITLSNANAYLEIETAPNLPQAIATVVNYSLKGESLRILHLLDERGRLQGSFTAPKEWLMNTVAWTQKGEIALMGFVVQKGGEKPRRQWFQLQKSTLQIQPLAEKPTIAEETLTVAQHPEGLHVRVQKEPVSEGENEGSEGKLWLEGDPKNKNARVLISGDSGSGELNIMGEQVIYNSQGALFAAPILKTDKATLLALLRNRKKMVAISNAKQLGLGLMMYAQDNNETFPSGDPNEKISPYLKNPSLFDGFNYTFGGGPLGDITNPSQTELGYVQGDGGRAYLYADGHVGWRDD